MDCVEIVRGLLFAKFTVFEQFMQGILQALNISIFKELDLQVVFFCQIFVFV